VSCKQLPALRRFEPDHDFVQVRSIAGEVGQIELVFDNRRVSIHVHVHIAHVDALINAGWAGLGGNRLSLRLRHPVGMRVLQTFVKDLLQPCCIALERRLLPCFDRSQHVGLRRACAQHREDEQERRQQRFHDGQCISFQAIASLWTITQRQKRTPDRIQKTDAKLASARLAFAPGKENILNHTFVSKCLVITAVSALPLLAADLVANGLNNPRGLAIAPNGDLYVAEAGTGGSGPCVPTSDGTTPCFGTTGSVTKVNLRNKTQERIATGLPSLAGPGGAEALGPAGISFQGQGNAYVAIGMAANPALRGAIGPTGAAFQHLVRVLPNGNWSAEADLGTFEITDNPAGGPIDSDPFGVVALPGKQVVADAGGNDLLEVRANGSIRTLAVLPNLAALAPPFLHLPPGTTIPAEPVPTTVALGPDGAYYVGQLTGFPFQPGLANVYRVPANGGTPTVALSGFTNIISIAFGPDGALYVLEISKNGLLSGDPHGALIKVKNGVRTELAAGELFMPGGMAIASDGTIYVSNWSVLPADPQHPAAPQGQVLAIHQ